MVGYIVQIVRRLQKSGSVMGSSVWAIARVKLTLLQLTVVKQNNKWHMCTCKYNVFVNFLQSWSYLK